MTMKFQNNVSLASYNWFQTGGSAQTFCEPESVDDYLKAMQSDESDSLFVLGEGANILIADSGFAGLVLHPKNNDIQILDDKSNGSSAIIRAGAGTLVQQLIDFSLAHNLSGLEVFSGIPGTVGGAVYINLHYFEALLSEYLVRGHILHRESHELSWVDNKWFQFGYDQSRLHQKDYLLVEAEFRLQKVSEIESAYARGRRDEIIRHRNRRYPQSHTCGSFFRNFSPEEVNLEINDRPMIYVAYYLDKLGVKGELKSGGAQVSTKHANMLVTDDSATSEDVVNLARKMQKMVYEEFGIIPQPECQLIGFREYPLMDY